MERAKITTVKFDNNDVIATSGGGTVRNAVTFVGAFDCDPVEELVNHRILNETDIGWHSTWPTTFNVEDDNESFSNESTVPNSVKGFVGDMFAEGDYDRNSPGATIEKPDAETIYNQIRGAKFEFNGNEIENNTYSNVRTGDNGLLWIDRNGNGQYDDGTTLDTENEAVTFTDVIHSTTGTRAEINATKGQSNWPDDIDFYDKYIDIDDNDFYVDSNNVKDGVISTDYLSFDYFLTNLKGNGVPKNIILDENESNPYSLKAVDHGKLTYTDNDGKSLTYNLQPTFFDTDTDNSIEKDYLKGTQEEIDFMKDNSSVSPSTVGFQGQQIDSLADIFSKTVWRYNVDSNTFTNDTKFVVNTDTTDDLYDIKIRN